MNIFQRFRKWLRMEAFTVTITKPVGPLFNTAECEGCGDLFEEGEVPLLKRGKLWHELCWEDRDTFDEIATGFDNLPVKPPEGTRCERDLCNGVGDELPDDDDETVERPLATTVWVKSTIEDGKPHLCYIYVCDPCSDSGDDDWEWPVDEESGELLEAVRCIS